MFQKDLLKDQVALITGGGTGIGFGIAQELARYGADVAIASRKREHLDPAVEKLREFGTGAHAIEANVRDPESVKRMVSGTVDRFGRLDILVNNAAGNFYAPSADLSPNGWRAVVETDLYGTFFVSQAAYPHLRHQDGGRIISISMTLHYRGWPQMAHASAAKAGVDALTRTLALEWAASGITVNAIAPGPVKTEGATAAFSAPKPGAASAASFDDDMLAQIPLGRWGRPVDIANLAVFLAGPGGEWITGAIYVVDGGSWMARV